MLRNFSSIVTPYIMAELLVLLQLHGEREARKYKPHADAFDSMTEDLFRSKYRLSKDLTMWLIEQVQPVLEGSRANTTSTALNAEQQVLMSLRFYACGGFQGTVATDECIGVTQSTVSRILHKVTDAIISKLGYKLNFPHTEELLEEKTKFMEYGGIPGIIGCIDGTLIAIKGPSQGDDQFNAASYWCRKDHYAINALVVSDADLRIIFMDARFPGSVHDAFIWRNSALRLAFEEGRAGANSWLLGDSGLPTESWLLTPVPGEELSRGEQIYNRMHKRTRATVERCFGVLKNRFRCLQKYRTLHYDPVRCTSLINACAILHNLCIEENLPEPDEPHPDGCEPDDDGSDDTDCVDEANHNQRSMLALGKRNRQQICDMFERAPGHFQ